MILIPSVIRMPEMVYRISYDPFGIGDNSSCYDLFTLLIDRISTEVISMCCMSINDKGILTLNGKGNGYSGTVRN